MKNTFTSIALAIVLVVGGGFVNAKAEACGGPCFQNYGGGSIGYDYYPQQQYQAYPNYAYNYGYQTYPNYNSGCYSNCYQNQNYGYNGGGSAYNNYYPTTQPYYNQPYYSNNGSIWGSLAYGVTTALLQNSYNNSYYDNYSYYPSSYDYGYQYGY